MPTISDAVTTPDGTCPVTLAIPDGEGPWPGVVMYPDAGGTRSTAREMAERLAGLGYVVLLPDVYYRSGKWAPFSMSDVFNDKAERQRLFAMIGSVTPDAMETDARAFFESPELVRIRDEAGVSRPQFLYLDEVESGLTG